MTISIKQLQENKELIKSLVDEVFNKHSLMAIDKYHARNLSLDSENALESLKKSLTELFSGFPDLQATIEHIIAENNFVVVFLSITGTNTSMYKGLPATNKPMQIRSADLYRIENCKIVAHCDVVNSLHLLKQTEAITYTHRS